jgi:hypothetical protein
VWELRLGFYGTHEQAKVVPLARDGIDAGVDVDPQRAARQLLDVP